MPKIVVSQWLADFARDRFGDPHVVVVPNGVDLNLFHAPPRGKQSRPTVGMLTFRETLTRGTLRPLLRSTSQHGHSGTCSFSPFGTGPLTASMPLPPDAEYTRMPPRHLFVRFLPGVMSGFVQHERGSSPPPHEAMTSVVLSSHPDWRSYGPD